MSRLGKRPVTLPDNVTIDIKGNDITVKGPLGALCVRILPGVTVMHKDKGVFFERKDNSTLAKKMQGTACRIFSCAVQGVSAGFRKDLSIVGIGYRAEVKGTDIVFNIGYSHQVIFPLPQGITAKVEKNTFITVQGIDKQLVGEVAAQIRGIRPPEPYQGSGIRYLNEIVHKKAGKAAAVAGGTK